jgi:hypothetical protein
MLFFPSCALCLCGESAVRNSVSVSASVSNQQSAISNQQSVAGASTQCRLPAQFPDFAKASSGRPDFCILTSVFLF